MSCGIGRRCSLDPMWLWLWCRSAATAPIQPLAWEFPYAMCVALKRQRTKKNKTTKTQMETAFMAMYSYESEYFEADSVITNQHSGIPYINTN